MTKALLVAVLAASLAANAHATWSIVVTDTKSGEVGVASATCLNNLDLKQFLPVIRVGKGAAATQASVNPSASNRMLIFDGLAAGTAPADLLAAIAQSDAGFQSRQIGIVDLFPRAETFTGSQTFQYAGGVTGSVGSLTYSVQGNILTGAPVINQTVLAIVNTPGDLADKLMAGMLAAQAMGGDGRCSCSPIQPTSCGAPPASFTKSAHVGFMTLARVGDVDGICTGAQGCANGRYYLDLNVAGNQLTAPDPVFQLQGQLASWRAALMGHPDHIQSETELSQNVLPDDGVSTSTLTLRLVDWQGVPITQGGANVVVTKEPGSDDVVTIGAVTDLGNGTYTVTLTAQTRGGRDRLRVKVADGTVTTTLYPFPEISVAPTQFLFTGDTQISASQGDGVQFALGGGLGLGDRSYLILASASGTNPGFAYEGVTIPLNPDGALTTSVLLCNSPVLFNTCSVLDGAGINAAALVVGPGDLTPLVGSSLDFAAVILDPLDFVSDPVHVTVNP